MSFTRNPTENSTRSTPPQRTVISTGGGAFAAVAERPPHLLLSLPVLLNQPQKIGCPIHDSFIVMGGNVSRLRAKTAAILPATLLALLAVGCASPGPPRPPSLKLPQPVTDLSAQRIGGQVILHWTTPAKTTDNLTIKDTLTARICRTAAAPSSTPIPAPATNTPPLVTNNSQLSLPCAAVLTLHVHPGPATATDTLPEPLAADPISVLDYRVQIENASGHAAGLSNPAYAAAGAAPLPVAALRATPTETGVMLEWTPTASIAPRTSVELDRVDMTLSATRQLQTETTTNPSTRFQIAGKESPEVHLRATYQPSTTNQQPTSSQPSTTNQPEPSGTIDQTARFGDIYRYTAQRVRSIELAGHSLELRSPISASVTIALHDIFPPATPTGLDAVPGQTASTNQPPTPNNQQPAPNSLSIDLSWQPNTEPDLAGYIVYRRQLPTANTPNQQPAINNQPANSQQAPTNNQQTAATRLTPTPILGPAFRDLTALPGQTYGYSITAIDTSSNESLPTPEVQQTLPQP